MKRTKLLTAVSATAVLALFLAGCGESSSTSGSTSAAGSTASSASAGIDAKIGTEFSGGSAGAASAAPIKIGLINQEGGQVSNPEASAAVKAAFDYINAEQKGIGGRPIELELCKVTSSEEEAQQCAQKFLNDSSISVVLQGGLNVGSNAIHQNMGGAKPDVVALANPGTDATADNTFAVNPSVLAALPGFATYSKTQGWNKLGIIVDDNPGNLAISQAAQGVFQGAGLTTTVTTFPAGSTDLTSAFTAAAAEQPDAISPIIVSTSGCIAAAKAVQTTGSTIPVLGSNLCATQDIKDALGDFPQWSFESTVLSLFAEDTTGQIDFYKGVMGQYAGADAQLGIDAPAAFGAAFLLAKVLNKVGPDAITPAAVSTGLKAYTDGVLLGTPKVAFGSIPDSPALSGIADRFYTYKDSAWTSTDWQSVPK